MKISKDSIYNFIPLIPLIAILSINIIGTNIEINKYIELSILSGSTIIALLVWNKLKKNPASGDNQSSSRVWSAAISVLFLGATTVYKIISIIL